MVHHSSFEAGAIKAHRFSLDLWARPKMHSLIYWIDGLLIDTGPAIAEAQILDIVSKAKLKQIFISHHHEDHTGNLKAIVRQLEIPAYSSSQCAVLMKDPPALSLAQKMTWGQRPAFDGLEVKEKTLETDLYKFQLIPIPGHAPDMCALHEEGQGWLFSADLYINHEIGYFLKNENMAEQIKSIKKVLGLGFETLLCAHQGQVNKPHEKLKLKLQFLEDFLGKVRLHQAQGLSAPEIFRAMRLRENWPLWLASAGKLSKMNMVKGAMIF